MDLLNRLPPEIGYEVLSGLPGLSDALKASAASSSLLRAFSIFKRQLLKTYVSRSLSDEGLLRDALAIVDFPCSSRTTEATRWAQQVNAHVANWQQDRLVYDTDDVSKSLRLEALCHGLWLFIEDFLSKATDPFLPGAYRRLPWWSHKDLAASPTARFDMDSLSRVERRRILQAFMRYELLCLIHRPKMGELQQADIWRFTHDDIPNTNPLKMLVKWDWEMAESRKWQADEPGLLLSLTRCVREYIHTLYGAMLEHQVQAVVPEPEGHCSEFENAPSWRQGNFNDCTLNSEWNGLDSVIEEAGRLKSIAQCQKQHPRSAHRIKKGWSVILISVLASTGFGTAATLLRSDSDHFRGFFQDFTIQASQLLFFLDRDEGAREPPKKVINTFGTVDNHFDYIQSFVRLYRQRAWGLFESRRPGPALPSWWDYRQAYKTWCGKDGVQTSGSIEDMIFHGGGIQTCPALERTAVSVWQVR